MARLRVRGTADLVALARQRGWAAGPPAQAAVDVLPAVRVNGAGGEVAELPPVEVRIPGSEVLDLPDAIVHGDNMSLVVEDAVYPGGLAHSFAPSRTLRPAGEGWVDYTARPVDRADAAGAELLGIVSHWGHFFVDAADRLLAMEDQGARGRRLLVADPDLFSLGPTIDDCGAVPQVSALIRTMGIPWTPQRVLSVPRPADWHVKNLRVRTLPATKPAMSGPTYRAIREKAGALERAPGDTLLFVARAAVKHRFIRNQEQMQAFLTRVPGGRTVFPEWMGIGEAIEAFSQASRVILPVGSAKFNLAFCRPGTRVVCINPAGYTRLPGGVTQMVRHLCHALDLRLEFHEVAAEPSRMLLHSNLVLTQEDAHELVRILDRMESA